MSHFVRVELHDATSADYDNLHTHMVAEAFYRTVTSSDGEDYWLPTATYRAGSWSTSVSHARDDAARAAAKTGCSFAVFATDSPAYWQGLRAVRKVA